MPWRKWIPGVLSKRQIQELCQRNYIEPAPAKVGASSFDLTLSGKAYKMIGGSVKPFGAAYENSVKGAGLAEEFSPNSDGYFELEPRRTYIFKLNEKLVVNLGDQCIYGQATAKSSIGRLDVLARLIIDGMDEYEAFDPPGIKEGNGNMYLEVTPMTFKVKFKEGVSLSQLRLFYGEPEDIQIRSPELYKTVLHGPGSEDGSLSVDLTPETIGGLEFSSFYAVRDEQEDLPAVVVEGGVKADPCNYWRGGVVDSNGRVEIVPNNFYIIRSKELVSVPRGVAIYCRATDEAIGEMRIHYAGFVHPEFGWDRGDGMEGTPLIFEIRGHDVRVSLRDREKLAKLTFYRMSEDDGEESPYDKQGLKLSKYFDDFPETLHQDEDGRLRGFAN